ncbi:MAG: LCP family protein [Clostridiales bacterium]|nr:LCP family protein [Clostridiales bacterium]
MAKDAYDIDKILSEIHQRQAREGRREMPGEKQAGAPVKKAEPVQKAEPVKKAEPAAPKAAENTVKKAAQKPAPAVNHEQPKKAPANADVQNELRARAEAEKEARRRARSQAAHDSGRTPQEKAKQARDMAEKQAASQQQMADQRRLEQRRAAAERERAAAIARADKVQAKRNLYVASYAAGEDGIDISAFVEEPAPKKKMPKKKKRKIIISVVCVFLAMVIAAGGAGWWYVDGMLGRMSDAESPTRAETVEEYTGMDGPAVETNFDNVIYEDGDVSTLKDMIKSWYLNGEPVSSSHVLNVLLVGEDTAGDLDSDTRADSAILCSVNVDTQKIYLTSILRDSYGYWISEDSTDGEGEYGKINGASASGGIGQYIDTVEKLYKINIDNYVLVNFSSFPEIIDRLGGVTINMSRAEVREINNNPKRYNYPETIEVDGEYTYDETDGRYTAPVQLTGEQALAYCRIRKIDGDDARADRQKKVLTTVFNDLESSTITTMLSTVNTFSNYVRTGYSSREILQIGRYALKNGWLNYTMESDTVPCEECREGGEWYSNWIWKVDYPKDAYELQMKLYGKSNIVLAEDRPDFKELYY